MSDYERLPWFNELLKECVEAKDFTEWDKIVKKVGDMGFLLMITRYGIILRDEEEKCLQEKNCGR